MAVAETSDGALFISCRAKNQILVFDGNNWDEIALPSPPRALVADQRDRVWISMEDGVGFVQRDALGQCYFQRFELHEKESDQIVFPVAFKSPKGVRFGNARIIADIDCSTDTATAKLYRAERNERFVDKGGDGVYSFFEDADELFIWEDGKRKAVPTEFYPGGVFACRLSDGRYLFADKKYKTFWVKNGEHWQTFSKDLEKRIEGSTGRWFRPLSGDRIGFATSEAFVCYDAQGELLWSVNKEGRRFGEMSDGRMWLSVTSGFYIVAPDNNVNTYSFGSKKIGRVRCIEVLEEGVFLSRYSGLFFVDLEKKNGTFPKLKSTKKLISSLTSMTWRSSDAHFAASSSGMVNLEDPSKTNFDNPILYGFTTSNQHHILSRSGGRVSVLDSDMKRIAEFVLHFDAQEIFEISPTKFWILGKLGRFVVAEFDSDFRSFEVKIVEGLDNTSTVTKLDGQLCIVTKDGIRSPKLESEGREKSLTLMLGEADERFSQLSEQFQTREIQKAVDCGEFGLLLCGSNHLTMHRLINGQYQAKPLTEWTISGELGNVITWDPFRSVVWATLDDGLLALLPKSAKPSRTFEPILKMAVSPPTAIHSDKSDDVMKIDSAPNISFSYGIPDALDVTPFQYRLRGLDEQWSNWTQTTVRNYDRLPSGEYVFEVRARSASGKIVSTSSDKFVVQKPWYATIPAIILFSLLTVGFVFGASSIRARQLAARNKKMEHLIAIRTQEIQNQKKEIEEKSELLVQSFRNAESEKLKSFDTLVAGISHDFNNLLAVISTNSELIGLKFGEPAEQMTDDMQTAIRSASELCGELSTISDMRQLNLVNDSLQGVVEEVLPLLQGTVSSEIKLNVRSCDEPTGVMIDMTEIKRAIMNLAVNAAEAAKHEILIETSVTFLDQEKLQEARFVGDSPLPGRFACVSICDDGPGIKPEFLGRLFDPFFSTNELGRGLGLSIVMRVLASHKGVILVEKSALGGACFRMYLPLVDQIEPVRTEPPQSAAVSHFKVLLVDDNSLVLESTSLVIKALGHEVFPATSAAMGFKVLKQEKDIDVIVLDIAMPVMSGVEMAEILLKEDSHLPIVFVSGHTNELIQHDLLEYPNVDYLNKPYRFSALNEKISQVCASRCTT